MISLCRQAAHHDAALSVRAAALPSFAVDSPVSHIGLRQLRLDRFLMASLSAAMFCVLVLVLHLQGLIEPDVLLQTFGLCVAASGTFVLIFLGRLNEPAADPRLTGDY